MKNGRKQELRLNIWQSYSLLKDVLVNNLSTQKALLLTVSKQLTYDHKYTCIWNQSDTTSLLSIQSPVWILFPLQHSILIVSWGQYEDEKLFHKVKCKNLWNWYSNFHSYSCFSGLILPISAKLLHIMYENKNSYVLCIGPHDVCFLDKKTHNQGKMKKV